MKPQGPTNEADDADLGIGEDDAPAVASGDDGAVAALLADPRFARLIDAAVARRVAEAAPAPAQAGGMQAEFAAFLAHLERVIDAKDEQKPGYFKPLSVDEINERAVARREMTALIRRAREEKWRPRYLLGEGFQGPSPAGPIVYAAGQEIIWRGAPADSFIPQNEQAATIFSAYKRWVGEIVSVDDLLEYAVNQARGGQAIEDTAVKAHRGAEDIEVVDAPIRDMAPKRILGTSGIEVRGEMRPRQPGVVAQPQGPVFVGEAA